MTDVMTAQVIFLIISAIVFGSAAFYAARQRQPGASGPGWLTSLAVWVGVLALIVLLYQGAQFWSAIGAMLSGR